MQKIRFSHDEAHIFSELMKKVWRSQRSRNSCERCRTRCRKCWRTSRQRENLETRLRNRREILMRYSTVNQFVFAAILYFHVLVFMDIYAAIYSCRQQNLTMQQERTACFHGHFHGNFIFCNFFLLPEIAAIKHSQKLCLQLLF